MIYLSDIIITLFAIVIASNTMILFLGLIIKSLEKKFNMQQLDVFLKAIIVYMVFPMFVFVMFLIFSTNSHRVKLNSIDFSNIFIVGKKTISLSTVLGNHWLFITIVIIWLIGSSYSLIYSWINDTNILKRLINCCNINQIEKINNEVMSIGKKLQINKKILKNIKVLTTDSISSPFMTGLFNVKIFIPEMDFSDEELRFILYHEMNHCSKNDYLYRRLVFLLRSLYWFNPMLSLFAKHFYEINEMACDEKVLEYCENQDRGVYGHLLLKLITMKLPSKSVLGLVDNDSVYLERRIINIMKKKKSTRKAALLATTTGAIIICSSFSVFASHGVMELQNIIVENAEDENAIEDGFDFTSTERIEYIDTTKFQSNKTKALSVAPKGSTYLDFELDGKQTGILDSIYLSKGSKVSIGLSGNPTDANYRVVLTNSDGLRRYVSSKNGIVDHTFSINSDDDYVISIEGRTSKKLHITGNVMIY